MSHLQVAHVEADTAHARYNSRAELYARRQLVADRIHACLLEVEAAKKHYVESHRAFFRANDEHEEVENLIRKLEEEDATIESSQEAGIVGANLP